MSSMILQSLSRPLAALNSARFDTGQRSTLMIDAQTNETDGQVRIPEIQGAGHISPFNGQEVMTGGIVTAVTFNGYYMQDAEGDGDDATSDGIFVFTGSGGGFPVAIGDEVSVQGTVSEFIPGGADTGNLSTTQIVAAAVDVITSANALPEAVLLGAAGRDLPTEIVISESEQPVNLQEDPGVFNPETDGIDFYEALEGMRVTVDDPVAVSATNRFGETWVVADNGANITSSTDGLNDRGGININARADGFGDLNPERIQLQFSSLLPDGFNAAPITLGEDLSDVTGVVGYAFGNFEVLITEAFDVDAPSANTLETTTVVGNSGTLTVASYNILNVTANPEDGDADQIDLLASHIVDNLGTPDIIGLQEVQDDSGVTNDGTLTAEATLQAIVDAIVEAGGPTYAVAGAEVDEDGETGGVPGGNIRNAFLYNPGRVEAVEIVTLETEELTAFGVTNPNAFDGTRDPLLGTFAFAGEEITIINNHLTSRFGSTPIYGGPQPFVQAGEAEREAETTTLNEVVDAILAEDAGANVMVLGDLNTFEFTDELAEDLPGVGEERVLTNLINQLEGEEAYTFVFQGNSQVLDHIFVTDGLLAEARIDVVHVNNDFPTFASDHEPVIASVELRAEDLVVFGTNEADTLVGGSRNDELFGLDRDDVLLGLGGDDIVRGGAGDDLIQGGAGNDFLMGGEGEDVLAGEAGNDILIGDDFEGDRFVFGANGGNDIVTDFQFNEDQLVFEGLGVATAEEALALATQDAGSTVFSFEDGTTVTLFRVDLEDLSAADIVIG